MVIIRTIRGPVHAHGLRRWQRVLCGQHWQSQCHPFQHWQSLCDSAGGYQYSKAATASVRMCKLLSGAWTVDKHP